MYNLGGATGASSLSQCEGCLVFNIVLYRLRGAVGASIIRTCHACIMFYIIFYLEVPAVPPESENVRFVSRGASYLLGWEVPQVLPESEILVVLNFTLCFIC